MQETASPVVDCAEPMTVGPSDALTLPFGLVQLHTTGGSGAPSFALVEDETGATLNAETGAYVAGSVQGTDLVAIDDVPCGEQRELSIVVVEHMWLSPQEARLAPGATLGFDVGGGSGAFDCGVVQGAGTLEDCVYTASDEGIDIVRFEDLGTSEFVDVPITVTPAAAFTVSGFDGIWAPLGASFEFEQHNGSGEVDLEVLSGDLGIVGSHVVVAGDGVVRVRDRFSGEEVEVEVHAIDANAPDIDRDGERSGEGAVLSLGDVDGDGYSDALLGAPEVSTGAYYSGAAYLYAGSALGLDPTPVQIFEGATRLEGWGRSLATGDVDGDGDDELLIGAGGVDLGATNTGGVRAYGRLDGGFFDPEPLWTLGGDAEYDRFGDSMALCDFDADGWLDLAVGAPDAHDTGASPEADDQGAIHVFKGSADGFEERADFVLWGVLPDGSGGFAGLAEMHLGEAVAAGDFDGDGFCDLAAAADEADFDAGSSEDGVVLIYQGTSADGLVLRRDPVRFLAVDDSSGGEFGRRMSTGDVDGDGAMELAVTRWKADDDAENGGAVHVFALRDLSADPTPMDPNDAVWTMYGASSSDYVGSSVDFEDLDGDGQDDLLIGAYRDEEIGGDINEGAFHLVGGGDIESAIASPPIVFEVSKADRTVFGSTAGGRLGQALAGLPDADGDGEGDVLAFAGYDPSYGAEAGAPWYLSSDTPWKISLLEMPAEPAGHEVGRGITSADLDGDGDVELVVGVPGAGADEGANAGLVYAWELKSGATTGEPYEVFGGHETYSGSDRFGYRVTTTDFDGDGYDDVVVVARKDSHPTTYGDEFVNPEECPGYSSLAGGLFIYRGTASGVKSTASWAWHADESSGYIDVVAGGFDRNGDGREDLVVGSTYWNDDAGGFALIEGRKRDTTGTLVICDAELYLGSTEFDRLGYSVAGLGDLDDDGCDEVAVGATGEETHGDYYNQGIVRVLWGTCSADDEVTNLGRRVVGSGLGSSLAGGSDVDGDGIPELLVGGAEHRVDFAELGGAWLIPGSHIVAQERATITPGVLPDLTEHVYFAPDDGLGDTYGLIGPAAASLFGEAVAFVEDPAGGTALAVGVPQGGVGGTALSGGVALYRFGDDDGDGVEGIDAVPFALVVGEDFAPLGQLGGVLLGTEIDGDPTLLVGAPQSSATGLELGAVYVVTLE